MLTAKEARELSDKNYPSQIPEIITKIKDATTKGDYKIIIDSIDSKDKKILTEAGYSVYIFSGDQRDPSCVTIAW